MYARGICVAAVGLLTASVSGQSLNIDFGVDGVAPPDTYGGAADQAGQWITLPGTQGVTVHDLVDIDGNVTEVSLFQFGGTETLTFKDRDVAGDHAILMNDCLITHTNIESCLFFNNFEPGMYEVFVYARMPAMADIQSLTSVDQEDGIPHHLVGGEWSGDHELFVTYAYHIAVVGESGDLDMHSGVPNGGNFDIGAALNGVQIRKLPDDVLGDLDGDGTVGTGDLLILLGAWGACDDCEACDADLDQDCAVGAPDLIILLGNWG